ncbi:carbohydrate-binding module family 50 protein [Ramaria rubella]|nr:carbohydrate-binding module family 50 protein [Ramaria rubella]
MIASLFVAAIAALPFVASQCEQPSLSDELFNSHCCSQALPSNCARTYNVVEGDTCDAISAANNASTYQLAVVNNPTIDATCSNLAINQKICLGTTGEDCQTTYVVAPNDTCNDITSRIGVNATILYANNPQIDSECTNLYVGQVLCTLGSVRVPPAPANMPVSSVSVAPGTATAAPAPSQTPAGDDDDLPWCDDPNDDGEW